MQTLCFVKIDLVSTSLFNSVPYFPFRLFHCIWYFYLIGKRGHFHMTVRQKSGERKKPNQYASPLRKMRRHKRKAINMSSSTSSSGIKDNSFLFINIFLPLSLVKYKIMAQKISDWENNICIDVETKRCKRKFFCDSCLSLVNHVTTTSFHLFIFPDFGKVLLNLNIPVK